ncbi:MULTISPECIES: anti-sigma factor [Rhodomicrobium]|uniref:anti-sigma factor n=1 Tax=Rhodomicrobium TaxID=1068 RepID=UPI000B4B5042|nr:MULTISPECIES: anti-sigma factor [Rhodomicrobium]
MNELDDIDALAGEYVLGTLDAAERAAIAARRRREPALDRAILRWESQFAPLLDAGEPIAPPADLFARIETRLGLPERERPGNVVELRRKLSLWRSVAAASTALAASLAFFIAWQGIHAPAPETRLVAVLQKDSASPAFLVTVDLPTRTLTVKPLTSPAAPDKSYELWLINAKLGDPRSLGVISAPLTVSQRLHGYDPATIEASAVAISLEPKGGSPTGKVTGPVLYSGPLISAPF